MLASDVSLTTAAIHCCLLRKNVPENLNTQGNVLEVMCTIDKRVEN